MTTEEKGAQETGELVLKLVRLMLTELRTASQEPDGYDMALEALTEMEACHGVDLRKWPLSPAKMVLLGTIKEMHDFIGRAGAALAAGDLKDLLSGLCDAQMEEYLKRTKPAGTA